MTTPTTSSTEGISESATIHALIEQLRPAYPWKPQRELAACGIALLFLLVAFLMGWKFVAVYSGVLAVVLMLHDFAKQRNRRQIDLLIRIAEELEKKNRDRAA